MPDETPFRIARHRQSLTRWLDRPKHMEENQRIPSPLSPRDARRNFACLVWMGSVFAMGWSEVVVVLQPLLVHYKASNTQIGLVQGVLIATLPGMFFSPWITLRFPRKKIYLYVTDTLYLLPLGLVGVAVWSGGIGGNAAMVTFIVWMMVAGQIAAGFGGLPNQEFFTSCIPMRLRGRLAGISAGLGGLLGIGSTAFAAWVLAVLPEPQSYGVLLVMAWLLCQLADTSVLFAKEPPTPVKSAPRPWSMAMWRAFFHDSKFLRLTIAVSLISPLLAQLAVFSTVFAFRDLGFKAQMAAWLGMTAATARLSLSPAAGWVTDHWGARPSILMWTAMVAGSFLLLAIAPVTASVYVAAGIAAVAGSGFSGAMNALTSAVPLPEHRAGHFTLLAFCMVGTNSLGPLLVGWLLDHVSYRAGFTLLGIATAAVVTLGAWLLRDLGPGEVVSR
ncbi:MAG: MFS transporter [Gloeobacteraceae cyanobacterium ES-bin-144]|nr:MFS transporter [Verrucomicrobiales bacterium]